MKVAFRTKKLKKQYEDGQEAIKAYGDQVGRRYVVRINIIKSAQNLEELKALPELDCHQLKGNRAGQWAIKLTGFDRLIFTLEGGQLEIVRIEKVSKHYGD